MRKTLLISAVLTAMTNANANYNFGIVQPTGSELIPNHFIEIEEHDITIKQHREALADKVDRINALEATSTELNKKINSMIAAINKTTKNNETLLAIIDAHKQKEHLLNKTISNLEVENTRLSTTLSEKNIAIRELHSLVGSNKSTIHKLTADLASATTQIKHLDTLTKEHKTLVETNNKLVINNKELDSNLTLANEKLIKTQVLLKESVDSVSNLGSRIDSVDSQTASNVKKVDDVMQQIDSALEANKKTTDAISEITTEQETQSVPETSQEAAKPEVPVATQAEETTQAVEVTEVEEVQSQQQAVEATEVEEVQSQEQPVEATEQGESTTPDANTTESQDASVNPEANSTTTPMGSIAFEDLSAEDQAFLQQAKHDAETIAGYLDKTPDAQEVLPNVSDYLEEAQPKTEAEVERDLLKNFIPTGSISSLSYYFDDPKPYKGFVALNGQTHFFSEQELNNFLRGIANNNI